MTTLPEEFNNAISITGPHRYAITQGDSGADLHFGLLGTNGINHYFKINSEYVAYFGIELHELARATKYISRDPAAMPPPSHLPFKLPMAPDNAIAPFVGPELKFHRAIVHFGDAEDLISQYSRRVKIGAIEIERNEKTITWEINFSEPPPAIIPLVIGDTIHNLRSSLDHMVCDLARIRGKKPGQLKFPFAMDEAKLKSIMKADGHLSILGQDVYEAILALRPYKVGGDKMLRALHDLDIADKHQLILPSYMAAWHKYDFAEAVTDSIVKDNPSVKRPKIAFFGDGTMEHTFFKQGDRIQREIGDDPLKYYKKLDDGVHARFPAEFGEFSGAPILDTLSEFIELVQIILSDFKSKFADSSALPAA
ncbi:hypothetical protein Y695_01675 [Hydrogenophaga sp. T4]|nr:hypothetical protein Y695_01675 [Hydrogenophaga sp. T4]